MIRRVPQNPVSFTSRVTPAKLQSARFISWLLFALLPTIFLGCGATVDPAAERHAKAVKALIDLGAEVFDVEDEVTHDRGTYVLLFKEHFTTDGQVQGDVLKLIREIQALFLGVTSTPIRDEALPDLAKLPNLHVMNATDTKLTNRGLKLIAASRDLRLLKLNRTHITDDGLECLREMPSLRLIYLGDTDLSVNAVRHLAKLPQLEAIKLTALPITDEGLSSLSEMPRLRFLALDGTAVTDAGLKHLDLLPKLTYLDLQNTVVSLDAIKEFRTRHPKCFVKE